MSKDTTYSIPLEDRPCLLHIQNIQMEGLCLIQYPEQRNTNIEYNRLEEVNRMDLIIGLKTFTRELYGGIIDDEIKCTHTVHSDIIPCFIYDGLNWRVNVHKGDVLLSEHIE